MNLSDVEQHIFSYFLAHGASDLGSPGRFYPYGDLLMTVRDRMRLGTRKFGPAVSSQVEPAARAFLNAFIERGAFSIKTPDIGGTMHQFVEKEYRRVLLDLQDNNAVLDRAREGGDTFWADTFSQLVADTGK